MMNETFDRDVLQESSLDGQGADDQSRPITLLDGGGHRWTHGPVIPLHVPHYFSLWPGHGSTVSLDHSQRRGLVAYLRFGQDCKWNNI